MTTATDPLRPVSGCAQCRSLDELDVARGPTSIAARITLMLATVAGGLTVEEVPPGHESWSRVTPDALDLMVTNGPYPPAPNVDDEIVVVCRTCGTRYRQSWVFERGYEKWTVTPAVDYQV